MAASTTIAPLTNSQKLFLQRLLVAHVLTDEHAKQLYQSIKEGFADVTPDNDEDEDEDEEQDTNIDHGYMGNDLDHCLGIINASLVPAFNLEVCTVSLAPPYNADNDNNDDNENENNEQPAGRKKKRNPLVKYHAIVNRSNDTVAQLHAFPLSKGIGPHEMAYFRLAIEKIVERGVEQLESEAGGNTTNHSTSVGCPGALNRMELINLRTELDGAHKDKLTIAATEFALELLETEGWLVRVAPPADDEEEDDDDDGDEEEDEEEGGSKRKKRRKKRPSSTGSRRKSLKGTFYGVGPRSFMELGDFLQKAGLPGDRMPQSILHRI
ncbi:hypothetical protein ACHAXR_011959 [Thalassiosira sp. AJA248-18]